jgi:hypothetical protein
MVVSENKGKENVSPAKEILNKETKRPTFFAK